MSEMTTGVRAPQDLTEERVLSAEDILGAEDRQPVKVYVAEWGGHVTLRPLSAAEALSFMTEVQDKAKANEAAVRLLVRSAVNPDGSQMFTKDSVERLMRKSLKPIVTLQNAALVMNGLREDKKERDAAKNE